MLSVSNQKMRKYPTHMQLEFKWKIKVWTRGKRFHRENKGKKSEREKKIERDREPEIEKERRMKDTHILMRTSKFFWQTINDQQ